MESSNAPIPASAAEITPQWVQQITGHKVLQEDFSLEGDLQAGIGFLSTIIRVAYKTEGGESHQIIVKLLPTDPKWLEFAIADSSDEREILFYSKVLPDILQVIPEIQENICPVYNGTFQSADAASGVNRASMLVMEDLKLAGFQMMEFSGDKTEKTIPSLMTFLARFHFGALAVEADKGVSLRELYPFMQGAVVNSEWHSQMHTLCDDGYRQLNNLLLKFNMPPEIWDTYLKLKPHTEKMVTKIDEEGYKYPCMVHTDVWPPNIMVHDTLPVKVLDFQLLGYRDVTYDLSVLLITVLTKENLTMGKLRKYIRQYYDEFEQLCQRKGYGDKIKRRGWEEFEEFFFTWGCAFGYLMFIPSVDCYAKDFDKYANVFRVLCEDVKLPQFLENACKN